ncbi:MAG TPA: lasso peptide biosynthesis B2 protein [Gemmatimonadales bacterium]|nr:lasso peptide biosynthesis B2 protein [Gemmatimonadales bacterium]
MKSVSLNPRDWVDLLAAQAALARAQLLVWIRRPGALLTPMVEAPAAPADPGAALQAECVAHAVSRAARHGLFRPSCLVRAVALHQMLQARGLTGSSLRVGVRREGAAFLAHAWVDYRGMVLGEEEWHVKQFEELARMGVPRTQ